MDRRPWTVDRGPWTIDHGLWTVFPQVPMNQIDDSNDYPQHSLRDFYSILFRHKDGKRYGCALDFRDALAGKEFLSFYLEPQDIVYVPRTKISQVNLWIDQYINQMIPRVGFTYSTPVGSATIGFTPPTTVVTQP